MNHVLCASLAFFLFVGSFSSVNATLACDVDAQCSPLSLSPEYVVCDKTVTIPGSGKAGVCRCLVERGFSGMATTQSKCYCNTPSQVYYKGSGMDKIAYCTIIDKALLYDNEKAMAEYYKAQTLKIYESLAWPTPAFIMQELIQGKRDGIMSTIFAHDAKGRVDPMGEFIGYEGIVEYFYGTIWTPLTRAVKVEPVKILTGDRVSNIRIILTLEQYSGITGELERTYNLTQTSTFIFNSQGLVEGVESIIHELAAFGDSLTTPKPSHPAFIQQTCGIVLLSANCTADKDPEGHYASFEDCVAFLSGLEFGTWGNLRSDTVVCRFYHSVLAIARPQVHCSHSGKTGGHKCTTRDYNDYYKLNFLLPHENQ